MSLNENYNGYHACPTCNGEGLVYIAEIKLGMITMFVTEIYAPTPRTFRCPKCGGIGKVSWVDIIFREYYRYQTLSRTYLETSEKKFKAVTLDEYQQKYKTFSQ